MRTSELQHADSEIIKRAFDQNPRGIAIHDLQGQFIYVNSTLSEMFDYTANELLGQSWRLFYPADKVESIEEEFQPALQEDGFWHGELEGIKKNGDSLNVDVFLSLLLDNDDNPIGCICYSENTTVSSRIRSELFKQKHQSQLILDHSPVLIASLDNDLRFRLANKMYCVWAGKPVEEIIGAHVSEVLNEQAQKLVKPYMERVMSGEEIVFEMKFPHHSGKEIWIQATYVPDLNSRGEMKGFYIFLFDIDARKRQELENKTLLHGIDRGMEGFGLHDDKGCFSYVNPSLAAMFGYETEELLGKSWEQLYDEAQQKELQQKIFPILEEKGQWRGELRGLKKSSDFLDVEVSLTLLQDDSGEPTGMFSSARDISERKRARKEVDFLAYHDSLTRLPNRMLFKERLEQAILHAERWDTLVAVLFIDLDHFKHVNDTLGHSVGDRLLQSVATRLQDIFRSEDTVARLSGDEFIVALGELKSRKSIDILVDKLLRSFRLPVKIKDAQEIYQGISIGISLYPQDGNDVETLMKNADAAMYRTKEKGRHGYSYYTQGLTDSAYENMLYRNQLQNALEKDEFELHYQPLISLEQKKIIGLEALIRWRHPEWGLIYPEKFIPHAEETSLIVPIGNWVIKQVCQQARQWLLDGIEFKQIAINVSSVQLNTALDDLNAVFVNEISSFPDNEKVSPQLFELEISETSIMRAYKHPLNQLKKIQDLGFSLAIDDFGTGYSSLSQLKHLPISSLKIDRSFVRDIADDPDDLAIIEAIMALGKTLKLRITGEGVENIEQHRLLQKLGCHRSQGNFYSRPCLPAQIPTVCEELQDKLDSLSNLERA